MSEQPDEQSQTQSDGVIHYCWRTFLAGLVTLLPIALTLYAIWWLIRWAERFFGDLARLVLPDPWVIPGAGVVLAILVTFLFGVVINVWLITRLVALGEYLLESIPVVKSVYSGLRDLLRFMSGSGRGSELKSVVSIELQSDVHVIGFVTDKNAASSLPELAREGRDPLVAVYVPLGYQIGGHTLYLPASRLTPLDLSIEEAMRFVLTAGVNRPSRARNA